ncbi:MAG: ABC transporter substrate-binding protein [Anaerolineales bacterium]|nr:ABC transporter substrate-binding protein [Anaerolineales bacterium]
MKQHSHKSVWLPLMIITLVILSACQPSPTAEVSTPTPADSVPTPTALPSQTLDSRSLTICLGDEPTTLYPYGSLNSAARSVLSAIYDGPMDLIDYKYIPVILDKIPSLEDGDAQVAAINVSDGDLVLDTDGEVVSLDTGVQIRPSGCRNDDCAITYDGSSEIEMDQMVVTFTMLEGLMWSDGEPLTAGDSVYSFGLASDEETPVSKFLIDRTQVYEVADDITIQWWGLPGYIDPDYYTNFWMPLPQHAWEDFSADDLLQVDVSTRTPLGWGPYIVQDWQPGESIQLIRNLNYFRADNELPRFDELTFLFMPDTNTALTALVDGTCDLLDSSVRLDGQVSLLQQMQTDEQAQLITARSDIMEWLSFGITPASYDDGYRSTGLNPDRPDIFGDERTRQAIAVCLDRQKVVDTVLFGLSRVPDTYLSFDHPLHNGNLQTYQFDPASGRQILERVGWVDHDDDPSTPRQALGVTNVPNGTPLILDYLTTSATQRRQVVEIFAESLSECGVGLNPMFYSASDFYAQGPTGPLFGRSFDLAQYALGVDTIEPQCGWFTTSQTPTEANNWVGTNVSGFSDPEFDSVCEQALDVLPNEPQYTSHQQAQSIFASTLPSIPLYMRLRLAATRFDFCGFTLDSSSPYALANLESFDYGDGCR